MGIKEISVNKIKLPFATEFSHSLRKRLSVRNVFVLLKDSNGEVLGCGEGAPRTYVTGENPETTISNIQYLVKNKKFPWKLDSIEQVWDYIDSLPDSKEMNSAICAIEMALLDSLAKIREKHVMDFFSQDYLTSSIIYGGAIPLASVNKAKYICGLIKSMGINKLKLKMGKDYSQNMALLEVIAETFQKGYELKVDINGVWDKKIGRQHIPLLKDYGVKILEQPISPDSNDIHDFFNMTAKQNIVLMADESACSLKEMEKISKEKYYGMINVRLSKCGGLRRSLKIIDYLRSVGLSFQIGCQLGESGLLSAAGRILCLLSSDAEYYDGSYDKYLLDENITKKNVSFEYGGIAYPLKGVGLGIDIDPVKFKKLSESSLVIK